MSSDSNNSNNHVNFKTIIVTIVTFVAVNTVSEVIKRRMPVATIPVAAPVAPAPARTLANTQKNVAMSAKASANQQKSAKNMDSFEKKMAARSKDRRLHYLPINIVHN